MRRAQYPKIETVERPEGWKPKLTGQDSMGAFLKQTIFNKKPGDLKLSSLVLRKTTIRDRGEAKRYRPQREHPGSLEGHSNLINRKSLGFDERSLCPQCNNITMKRLMDAAYSDFTMVSEKLGGHHYNPHELEQSALSCPLCRLFVVAFGSDFQLMHKTASPATPPSARGQCRFKVWARNMNIESRERSKEENLQVMALEWIDGQSDFIAELQLLAEGHSEAANRGKISTTLYSPKLSKETLARSLPQLLRYCHTKHPNCKGSPFTTTSSISPYATLPETKLPSRLIVIDWEKHGKTGPFLMESQGRYGVYATLSHCWGDSDTMPKTTRSTLEENLHSLSLDSSSGKERTICEAIDVCRVLKIPYLWVDSFCIIQHDPADPESDFSDWEWETLDMGRVYKDSVLTISAAGASDEPSNGLYGGRMGKAQYVKVPFRMKSPRKRRSRFRTIKSTAEEIIEELQNETSDEDEGSLKGTDTHDKDELSSDDDESEAEHSDEKASTRDGSEDDSSESDDSEEERPPKRFFYACLPPRSFDDEGTNSRLFSRGWVLQERLLSPRYLHFGKDQWFWQCRSWTVAEVWGFENGAMTVGADLGLSPALLKNPIKFTLWWTKVIESYSRMDFTFNSDRLIALAGLVAEIWKVTPQEYHHGLWSNKLYIQLLWSVSYSPNSSHTKTKTSVPNQTTQPIPSWSWLSMPDPVSYSDKVDVYEPSYDEVQQRALDYPELKIVRPMIEHRFKHDKSGNTTVLLIRGQVRKARLSSIGAISKTKSSICRKLNPDRVGPTESLARGLYNLDYPTTPLKAIEGLLKDKDVGKCRLDAVEYHQLDTCFCLRVADSRDMKKGREQTYAIAFLVVSPVHDAQNNMQYRRIGVGISTADTVSWFAGCQTTQLALI